MKDWQSYLRLKRKPRDPNAPRYGDLYDRTLAAAIDLLIIYIIFDPILFRHITKSFYTHIDQAKLETAKAAVDTKQLLQGLFDAHVIQLWIMNSLVQFVIIAAVIVATQLYAKNTPGKWLLGLKIVRRRTHGPVEAWRYILRIIVCALACVPFMLGIVWSAFNKERRGWHDMVAGTVVLNTRPEWWYWNQVKRGFNYVRTRVMSSSAVEESVAKPAAEKGSEDSDKPIH
jgi:uncharacterized RDD family membrane protein YckC